LSLQRQLRSAITLPSGASTTFQTLSDLGIQVQKGGGLLVNDAKLTAALANTSEVAKAFSNAGSGASGDPAAGLAVRLKALTSALTDTDGAVATRTAGLQASIKRSDDEVAKLQSRIADTKARLLKQYGGLDTKISELNSLNTYINQQFFATKNKNS
jgi:flagellar hook-associated protein 2